MSERSSELFDAASQNVRRSAAFTESQISDLLETIRIIENAVDAAIEDAENNTGNQ